MTKHTPGPWHVGLLAINIGVIEIGDDAQAKRRAVLNASDYIDHGEEMVANAILIASAPKLLEACKKMLAFSDSRMQSGSRSQKEASFADELSDLIAKAEGGK